MVKTFWTSKTVWFGILQIIYAAIGSIFNFIDGGTASTLFFTGLASIGLRLTTSQPIK